LGNSADVVEAGELADVLGDCSETDAAAEFTKLEVDESSKVSQKLVEANCWVKSAELSKKGSAPCSVLVTFKWPGPGQSLKLGEL
jgi:hypothetical protein